MSKYAVSVFTESCKGLPAEQTFALLEDLGVTQIELGAGGATDTSHLSPSTLLRPGAAMGQFRDLLASHGLSVSALVLATNPIHPDKARAAADHQTFADTCRLASALGTDTLVLYAGCAGDCASSKHPNFIGACQTEEDREVLTWQWERVLIPYWKSAAAIAGSYGIRRLAFDMKPGNLVHNPHTLLRLREEVGSTIGAAVDPANLIGQGIDPAAAIRSLSGAVFHMRASDLVINAEYRAVNGFLGANAQTPLCFPRAVGNGHDAAWWQAVMSALRDIGYDRCVSLRYEDAHVPAEEGLPLAIKALQRLV
ncbi:MAG: sugar phosphate isomerase/epimerase [Ruminococcaceae bacterium]|nr:sugar phosphate isomerase/epimerase [Oscillospiraceae bacterium]